MVAEGRSINVTLIFSLARYRQVLEAYLSGLEALADRGGDLSAVHSVASFFVSRVDTEVDRRLEAIGTDEALALRGRAAVAQAKLAYQLFREAHTGARWERLADRGARVQRPLWASTSTKNPRLPRHPLRREPDRARHGQHPAREHLQAFEDHGTLARTIDVGRRRSRRGHARARQGRRRHGRRRPHPRSARASPPSRHRSPTSSAPWRPSRRAVTAPAPSRS